MLKKINRILKLVGLNLVRAKRKAPKSEAKRVKEFIEEFVGPRPPYTPEELEKTPLKCAVNQPGTVPLADYMGDAEWHNAPAPVGAEDHEITRAEHFDTAGGTTPEQNEARFATPRDKVVDRLDLAGKVVESDRPRVEQPNSDNKTTGPTS